MTPQKTYWHLQELKRKPSEYDIATSKLLYHPERGFEVTLPIGSWYQQYQTNSPLRCRDWEKFRDPRETTYTRYTEIQQAKEVFVEGMLRSVEDTRYDLDLPEPWVRVLDRVLAPLRYPVHGLQMIAAYVGQMGPCGRIAIAGLFQTADEIRRLQHLAYRMRQLQDPHPGFGETSRATWQEDPLWQPFRQVIEQLLVTYDWGESFVALNLVVKPVFDELFMNHFARLAEGQGDPVLAKLFFSLDEDCRWHREWSRALVRTALEDVPENAALIETWIGRWQPRVKTALASFAPVFEEVPQGRAKQRFSEVAGALDGFCRDYWLSLGLTPRMT